MPERGELVLIPFPFTDLKTSKRRPVLVLTSEDRYGDFIALPVTSRPQTEHGIAIPSGHLASGSLPVASWIRTDRIVTLHRSLVVKTIARLTEGAVVDATSAICSFLQGRS